MKKQALLVLILSLLLLAACGAEAGETKATDFRVACFGCKQEFTSGQLNADFGLCQDCMMRVGAAYCQNCAAPCYTRDMIQGLCLTCSAAIQNTTIPPETTVPSEIVFCEYCGYSVLSDYMIGDYCIGCYSIREGKCLRCTHISHLPDGCHCEHCSENWFYCASCGKRTDGNEMFLDICLNCYWRFNSVLVPCPLCGRSIAPAEVKGGYCNNCYAQAYYEETLPPAEPETYECISCGKEYKTSGNLYEGRCWICYNEDKDLCVSCQKRPSEGLGPSAMECSQCYYGSYATCPGCGYDYWAEDMVNGYCSQCRNDELTGTYYADFENVKITVTRHEYAGYYLTYTDLTSGITLKNIPSAYYDSNTPTHKQLVFYIDDFYPEHSGYVELNWAPESICEYDYNALIEGLEDTYGYYSPLTKE